MPRGLARGRGRRGHALRALPEAGASSCAGGEAHFQGEAGCAPLGACPAGEWADGLGGDVLFVRAGASGGDGSRASPFGTIAAALAAARAGTIVALSKGSFDEAVVLSSGVSLRGACAAETRLTAAGSGGAVVEVTASGAALEGLTIAGADRIGLRVSARARRCASRTSSSMTCRRSEWPRSRAPA
ncbi:MAG: DUF1565 domain-containing protein [Sandaracinaceae bacterium]|nr:DUF1565 domain-containing protein [Sandaracinaceae bacterium]